MKKEYTTPAVQCLGSVEGLTLKLQSSGNLDATFAEGTPSDQLTFS